MQGVQVENVPIRWLGADGEPAGEWEWRNIGSFLTEEAYIAFVDGMYHNDPEMVALDESVIFWSHHYDGERLSDLVLPSYADFVVDLNDER